MAKERDDRQQGEQTESARPGFQYRNETMLEEPT